LELAPPNRPTFQAIRAVVRCQYREDPPIAVLYQSRRTASKIGDSTQRSAAAIVLFGYSKDALDAVARYRELQQRVVALVCIAGPVGGSPLANAAKQQQADILRHWPKADCDSGDGRAVAPTYKNFASIDPRNDSQVICSDQNIPGSTLFGFLNVDHWAVVVPIDRAHNVIGSTVVNQNDYPREALLEALLRYVEEDLSASRQQGRSRVP